MLKQPFESNSSAFPHPDRVRRSTLAKLLLTHLVAELRNRFRF